MAEQVNLLELIRQQTPRVVQAVQNAGVAAVENASAAESETKQIAKLADQAAADQGLVVKTAQIGTMQAQQAARKALDAAGGFDAILSTISTLRAEQVRLEPELEKLRQENVEASGFSPIAWIKQAFDVNGTQAKVASSIETIKTVSATGQEIEQRVNAAGQLARNTAETMTVASVDAATREAETQWKIRAAQARLEALKYNTTSIEAIAGAQDKTLEVLMRAQNFERGEQQFQLALREEARRREQFDWQKEAALLAKQEKLEGKALDDSIIYKINLGRASRGDDPITGLEARNVIQLFKGNNPDMLDLHKKGEFAAKTGISLIGYSPADSARVISANPTIAKTLPEERKKALVLITEAQAALAVARGKDPRLQDDKDGTKAASFINDYVKMKVTEQVSSVGNNLDNPFHVGDLSSYIGSATNPGVGVFQTYPLVQKVLNPAIAGNISLTDPNTVLGLAQAAVTKGELTSSQAAADISNIYRRANMIHRKAVGFETLGISMPAGGNGYMARINGQLVDVTDFTAVARVMNKTTAQKMYGAMQSTPTLGPSTAAATYGRAISEASRRMQNAGNKP